MLHIRIHGAVDYEFYVKVYPIDFRNKSGYRTGAFLRGFYHLLFLLLTVKKPLSSSSFNSLMNTFGTPESL